MSLVPPFQQDPTLSGLSGIVHGFFGRRYSDTAHAQDFDMSETLGTDLAAVRANRQRARLYLGLGNAGLATLTQVHSSRVVVANAPFAPDRRPEEDRLITAARIGREPRPEADALVTKKPGLALGILTADCAPVLLADAKAGIIAACHAGRRGAAAGIIANTVAEMEKLGARISRIRAAIGPTISGVNYELSRETIDQMAALNPNIENFAFVPEGKSGLHFDLPGFVVSELVKLGIPAPPLPPCTYSGPARYFSHRRFTHVGGKTGRQISIIALVPEPKSE